ncbi:MAG TPA: cyclase [Pseudonocardiaceae bacterium]|jgi:dehydratase|nr:cyclase [Pseudonocardiaceae bacterium]
MTSILRRNGFRVVGIAMLAAIPLLGMTLPANAAGTSITYDLQSTAVGQTADSTIPVTVSATSSPATVAPGGAVAVTLSTGSLTVPSSADGYTIENINGIALDIAVPTNSTYVSCSLSGGSGLGSGTNTCSQSGSDVVVNIPGPISGGATATLPTLTINVTAGSSGSIDTQLAGTSYTDPGLTFTAVISVIGIGVNAPTTGYPTPSPVLASTTIS